MLKDRYTNYVFVPVHFSPAYATLAATSVPPLPSQPAHLSSESAEEGKQKLAEGEGKVLVEEVAEEDGHPVVRPASVHQQQTLQEPVRQRGTMAKGTRVIQ